MASERDREPVEEERLYLRLSEEEMPEFVREVREHLVWERVYRERHARRETESAAETRRRHAQEVRKMFAAEDAYRNKLRRERLRREGQENIQPSKPEAKSAMRERLRVLGLFKFGQRAHMEELVHEGHLFMRPLGDFVRMEADEFRADRDEGLAHSFAATGAKLQVEQDGEWLPVGTIIGAIRSADPDLRRANVFCMHAFRDTHVETLVDPRNLRSADTYVAFTDGDELIRRVHEEAKKLRLDLRWNLVEYVDPSTYRGPMGVFRKYAPFAYQSEFRFAILPGTGEPYSLRVGDLSDIAMMGDLAQLNGRIRVTVPEDEPPSSE